MTATAITIGFLFIALAMLLNLWRLLRGPDLVDRIVALDTMYINTVAFLVLLGIARGSTIYFEAGLVIAMLGFVGTIALGKFLLRGRVIE